MNSKICPICLCDDGKDVVEDFCTDSNESHVVCKECFVNYITHKIDVSYLGTCPVLNCPCMHPNSNKKPRMLKYPNWKSIVGHVSFQKYEKLAESVLLFLCGGCHMLKTLLVAYTVEEHGHACVEMANELECEVFKKWKDGLSNYLIGKSTTDDVYQLLSDTYPNFMTMSDIDAYAVMKRTLKCVPDPERRANLQLRHYRSRPHIWTLCCNKEHCFKCQTKDYHVGKTCEEYLSGIGAHIYDTSLVPCPSCGIALAKGDGCNTVTCKSSGGYVYFRIYVYPK